MFFNSKKDLLNFLNYSCINIGNGSIGDCYLNTKDKYVYKIYYSYLEDNEEANFDIDKFNNIKVSTFVFPKEKIFVNDTVVGYKTRYVKNKHLYQINPLLVDLDSLEKKIISAKEDVNILSNNNIRIYDTPYNILYGNSIKIIDTDEYSIDNIHNSETIRKLNNNTFDLEFYWFLIDNYFNDFVDNNKELNELYSSKSEDILVFLKLFRKVLSEYTESEVKRLSSCKKYINKKNNKNPIYIRNI